MKGSALLGHGITPPLPETLRLDYLQTPACPTASHPVCQPVRHFMSNDIVFQGAIALRL
jgi:hypothetical protein